MTISDSIGTGLAKEHTFHYVLAIYYIEYVAPRYSEESSYNEDHFA